MSENTLDNEKTGDSNTQDGTNEKTYTQKEVDDLAARVKAATERKLLKKYEGLGDPDELRQLIEEKNQLQQEQAMKRGDFEKLLKDQATKFSAEIQQRDSIIREYKVDLPLVTAAAEFKSIAPEQVKALLKSQIKMSDTGEVEVIDTKGKPRYNDKGELFSVRDLVKEFLDSNPHFVQPTGATTNTKNSHGTNDLSKVDVSKLDLSKAEHREIYAKTKGLKR